MTDPSEFPKDPFSPLVEMAVGQFELFAAYRAAGFTSAQALELVKTGLAAMFAASATRTKEDLDDND